MLALLGTYYRYISCNNLKMYKLVYFFHFFFFREYEWLYQCKRTTYNSFKVGSNLVRQTISTY